MKAPRQRWIGLLRGINVGGRNKIPMAQLRSLCEEAGWSDVETYIQSGNVLFSARADSTRLEAELEAAILRGFELSIPVIVRSASQWAEYMRTNPFPDASKTEAGLVMLALSKLPPRSDAALRLSERAASGERVKLVGDALWIHFPAGSGTSKLSPALLDRLAGSPVTMRNWRTVLKLGEMVVTL